MNALYLGVKELAQANIDQFDELAAFLGLKECRYHYVDMPDCHCAIGIMDTERHLAKPSRLTMTVGDLIKRGVIETDDVFRVKFIQDLHDYKINGCWELNIPPEVKDLTDRICRQSDVTPDLYKEIMRRIIAA
jgi:hypothetical protein